jgi:protein-S-isoprenylcysteine O-methyltransferase Ste14
MDLKGLGYLISTVSVVLLGVLAWPTPDDPPWKAIFLVLGMLASVLGMGARFLSHRKEKAAIAYAQREAERGNSQSGG